MPAGSPNHPAESSSPGQVIHCPRYGLVFHLLLLSTSPRGDAVTLGYGPENACPAGTFTLLIRYTLRRTGIGILPMIGRSRCRA